MKKYFYIPLITGISSLLIVPNTYASSPIINPNVGNVIAQTQTTTSLTGVAGEVNHIAQQITVRINSGGNGNGSGVIIGKQGKIYYVLTNAHVVNNKDQYQIITPDGQKYPVQYSNITLFNKVDLAVVQFTSKQTYSVATLANYNLGSSWVFQSGFSEYHTNQSPPQFTIGKVFSQKNADFVVKDRYSMTNGNELVYTNLSENGMTGGPLLDSLGRVVGIHTGVEGEIQFNQKGELIDINSGYSLGVPITTFLGLASTANIQPELLKIATSQPPTLSDTEETALRNQLLNIPVPSPDADAFTWVNYGNYLWRSFQYDKAVVAFDRAIQLNPTLSQSYYGKGLSLFDAKKYPESLTAFEQVNKIDPNFYQSWRWRGKALYQLQKYSDALAAYQQPIKLHEEKEFPIWMEIGDTLRSLKRYPDAIAAYNQALNIKPHPVAYNNRGLAYIELKEYQKAIADFTEAAQLFSKQGDQEGYQLAQKTLKNLSGYFIPNK